jgi:hypothetical protein
MEIWKHGKFVDLWSVVHLLAGFLLGGLFYLLGSQFLWSLIFALSIMLLWEVFELATGIIEESLNVIMDIIIGLAGFLLASWLYFLYGAPLDLSLNLTVLASTVTLALWGFIDFLKRGYR